MSYESNLNLIMDNRSNINNAISKTNLTIFETNFRTLQKNKLQLEVLFGQLKLCMPQIIICTEIWKNHFTHSNQIDEKIITIQILQTIKQIVNQYF